MVSRNSIEGSTVRIRVSRGLVHGGGGSASAVSDGMVSTVTWIGW
jgi:hypothetical protein